jgi:hypothetical protein
MNNFSVFSTMPVDNVTEPLIGREYELNLILQEVKKYHNISIIGDIKIGKTSILKSVEKEILINKNYSNFIPIYIDLKIFAFDMNADTFLNKILINVYSKNENIKNKFLNYSYGKIQEFADVIEYCLQSDKTIVLMLDKFDSVTSLKKLDENFFSFLRGYAYENGLSIITASRKKLETLCHQGYIAGSHFWNIFNPIILLSLLEDSAKSHILLNVSIHNFELRKIIIENVGNHPCFLKVAANAIKQYKISENDNINFILDTIYEELRPYYEDCKSMLEKDEKNVENNIQYKLDYISTLTSICKKDNKTSEFRYREINNLISYGYLLKENNTYKIYSPLFEKFLLETINTKLNVYEGNEDFVFISYSHADKEEVFKEINNLNNHKINVWYDEGLEGNWRKNLDARITNAKSFIVFISKNSLKSEDIKSEILIAESNKRNIIPIHLEEVEIKGELQYILLRYQQFFKYRDSNYMQKVLSSINNSLVNTN